ncbi:hypothetical protein HW555_005664, partial [Spodoptera exigua]
YCIVPQCASTSIKTPNKLFIYVPNNPQMRKKWLTLAIGKTPILYQNQGCMYFCEDHFDLQNDMLNYTEYLNLDVKKIDESEHVAALNDHLESSCPLKMDKSVQTEISQKKDKSMQAFMTPKFRSKAIQSKKKPLNHSSSPLKPSKTSSSTSPFKIKTIKKIRTSVSNINKVTRNILIEEEQSDNDIYVAPVASCSSSSLRVNCRKHKTRSREGTD